MSAVGTPSSSAKVGIACGTSKRHGRQVRGERGTVAYLGLGTQSGAYGAKGGLATVDYVEAEALVYDDAARTRFTLVLSATRPAGARNWLRLLPEPPEAMFIVRQTFGRRASWLQKGRLPGRRTAAI